VIDEFSATGVRFRTLNNVASRFANVWTSVFSDRKIAARIACTGSSAARAATAGSSVGIYSERKNSDSEHDGAETLSHGVFPSR
jgi:hypothetical protein